VGTLNASNSKKKKKKRTKEIGRWAPMGVPECPDNQAFYKQDKCFEEISESKKDQNKSFEDVMKSMKGNKQDDYEEETPLKKGGKANISMKNDTSSIKDQPDAFEDIMGIT
jgi:hypothetical protein